MDIVMLLIIMCLATCIIEALPFFAFPEYKKWIKPSLICNVITNPILNMILPGIYSFWLYWFGGFGVMLSVLTLIVAEVGVVFAEAWIYGYFIEERFGKRIKISFVLNAISFMIGAFLNMCLTTFM